MGASASTGNHHMGIMNQLAEAWRKFYHHDSHHGRANEAVKNAARSGDPNQLVAASGMAGEAQKARHKAAEQISIQKTALDAAVGKDKANDANKIAKEAGETAAKTATDAQGNATQPIDLTNKVQNALRLKVQFA